MYLTKIFAIRNVETGEFISYASKCAWKTSGAAKAAFGLHSERMEDFSQQKFDYQDKYELVDLTEIVYMYEGLCK
jgi:hypothetical protein